MDNIFAALILVAAFTFASGSAVMSSSSGKSALKGKAEEKEILMDFFNSTNGEYWTHKSGWGGPGDQCTDSWTGITCNGDGEVTQVKLIRNNQTGTLPESLGGLLSLEKLILKYGNIMGPLPSSIADLVQLTRLTISSHSITGAIPPLDKLTKLSIIELNDNDISGPFPPAMGRLTSLEQVLLHKNRISGTIPPLDNLTSLWYFDVGFNEIEGTCPSFQNFAPEWGSTFNVNNNHLSGHIPFFSNLPELIEINLAHNNLTGPVPLFEGLNALFVLTLTNNSLSGPLPDLTRAPFLEFAYFDYNELSGSIPTFGHGSLKTLYINNNNFTGPLPDLTNLTKLNDLCLYYNKFSGPIPRFPLKLVEVIAAHNLFNGSLPDIGYLKELKRINFSFNSLSGPLPSFASMGTRLYNISLSNNNFEGEIPSSVSRMTGLQQLDLSYNNLRGSIPNLSSLTSLKELYLSDNNLEGSLEWLANLTSLTTVVLDKNRFYGPLPKSFSKMSKLNIFVANENNLHGFLPTDLFELPNLQSVILSGNPKLQGYLPTTLSSPSLTALVIEGCDIAGYLPANIESNLTSLYLAGNKLKSRADSSIPILPSTLQHCSLANNFLSGSIFDDFFEGLPNLQSFDIRHNSVGGTIPSSIMLLQNLVDLNLELNAMSGTLPSSILDWPIYHSSTSTTRILFGNRWSCPVSDGVRSHSNDDPSNSYTCGDSSFFPPLLMLVASLAVFFFAINASSLAHPSTYFSKLYNDHDRGSRTEFVDDSKAVLNVYRDSLKIAAALVIIIAPLSILFYTAVSPFSVQPLILRFTFDSKTPSGSLIIPLLIITTIFLLFILEWGWSAKFHGDFEHEKEESEGGNEEREGGDERNKRKKKMSWRGVIKLFGLVMLTVTLLIGFDFVYVFYIANNTSVSPSVQALVVTLLAQAKSTLLSERWIARQFKRILRPEQEFNTSVFTMSVIVILSTIVVPSLLVLTGDQRCLKQYKWPFFGVISPLAPHETTFNYTFCPIYNDDGVELCSGPFPKQFKTVQYTTKFFYPWALSDQCFSAVIETYSPVVLESLIISDILQPSCWWLCREYRSEFSKWLMLALGLFNSVLVPQIAGFFSNIDRMGVVLLMTVGGVLVIMLDIGVVLLLKRLARGRRRMGEELYPSIEYHPQNYKLPPVDFLLDCLGLNFDEDMMLGDKWIRWSLLVDAKRGAEKVGSEFLTALGFKKGDYIDEEIFLMEEAFRHTLVDDIRGELLHDEEEAGSDEENENSSHRSGYISLARGRDLSYMYSDLVRTISIAVTFGLVSPIISFVASLGLLVRFVSIAFLVEIFQARAENGEVEKRTTDAQGLPFRCTVLIVVTSMGFFTGATVLAGVATDSNKKLGAIVTTGLVCGSFIYLKTISMGRQWGKLLHTCFERTKTFCAKRNLTKWEEGEEKASDEQLLLPKA